MKLWFPYALLIPALLLLALFAASQFGFKPGYGTPAGQLGGAAAWTLLFLIVLGHMRGWRSVRVFLIVFVVGKFSALAYRQLTNDVPVGRVLVELAGAAVLAWLLFSFFWPRRLRNEEPEPDAPWPQP
jgi:hypothetical protein